jgi:integrase
MPDNQSTREIYWKWFGRVLKYIHESEFDVTTLQRLTRTRKWNALGVLQAVPKALQRSNSMAGRKQFKEIVPSANKMGEHLKHACAMVLGVYGALRCDEIAHLEFKHFTIPDEGAITCNLHFDTKSGKAEKSEKGGNTFFIPDDDVGGAASIRRLIGQLNHDGITDGRIFRDYNTKKCMFQKPIVGKNPIADYPHRIAKELGLPHAKGFTGHAFRRTGATILADAGSTTKNLMRHGR